ncbi:FHA domain-containing protein [Candidatus Uabimicrobium amorphum]|uniref:FHA domain-containing protein n=1 Tax=Uabimicrobium amorphum TaxID=2596890 RepID=A0A5S9F3M3_UABAM|nr:FHA domain-containing protein [Candidatus Uabimicrobium amorphum]BBM83584.1 hypothetical protein UABAM_01937 [Candidatus Uabimicrobium amorphum]
MAIFFRLPTSGYQPLFQESHITDIKVAIVFAKRFNESVAALSEEERAQVPHSISCIYYQDTDFFIDLEHPTITKEEQRLSPPEKDESFPWRKSPQRLIFLAVQIFYSLAVGRLPASEIKFLPSKLLCNLSESNMILIKEFLTYGLAQDVGNRYQTFAEFSDVMDIIIKRLATQNTRRIPTTKVKARYSYVSKLTLFNFKSSLATTINICAPCEILIGRILDIEEKKIVKKTDVATIYENYFNEGQKSEYYIVIDNDNCISRKHVQVHMAKELENSSIQDLGSTHGTMIFTDSSCSPVDGMSIQGSKRLFMIPYDQYFQIGNTRINISTKRS